jgi:hypothetical protein
MHHFLGWTTLSLVAVSAVVINSLWKLDLFDTGNFEEGAPHALGSPLNNTQAQRFTGEVVDRCACLSASREAGRFGVDVG